MVWYRNKTSRFIFKTISIIIILAFLLHDISWACNWDFSFNKKFAPRAESVRSKLVGKDQNSFEQIDLPTVPKFNHGSIMATQLRAKASSMSINNELKAFVGIESAVVIKKRKLLTAGLKKLFCKTLFMFILFFVTFLPLQTMAQDISSDQFLNPPSIEISYPLPSASSITYIKKENGSFYLYRNENRVVPSVGMVYQPVPNGRHINDYKNNIASLYRALLDKEDGGQGHGRRLYNMGVRFIRIYELNSSSTEDISELKDIFRTIYRKYNISVLVGSYAGLYDHVDYRNTTEVKKAIVSLQDVVRNFCREPWILGWVVGNEHNLHLSRPQITGLQRKFLPELKVSPEIYFELMDVFAGAIKATLESENVHQIVLLGNGDLSDGEISFISKMSNIDALGINCYRKPEHIRHLIEDANRGLNIPLFFTEIGAPAVMRRQEKEQAESIQSALEVIYGYIPGVHEKANVIGAFVCEATDQKWKISETGETEEGFWAYLKRNQKKPLLVFRNSRCL
jgi:hypothetical protein